MKRLALIALAVALAAEAGLRLARHGWSAAALGAWVDPPPWSALRAFDATGDPEPRPGADVAWALGPDQPVVRYRLNGHGLRQAEAVTPRNAGTCRVLAVGDAYTFGYGVGEDEAYPRQLGRLLGPRVEVLNGGFPNLDVEQQARRLARLLPALSPDVVLLSFDWWNVPLGEEGAPRPVRWSRGWLVANLEQKLERLGRHVALVHAGFDATRRALTPAVFPPSGLAREMAPLAATPDVLGPRWQRTKAAIAEMAARVGTAGARFVVVVTPLDVQVDGARARLYRSGALPYPAHGFPDVAWAAATAMPAALAQFLHDAGIAFVDTTDAFRADGGADLFLAGDYHAADAGHRLIAREVARWFERARPCDAR